MRESGALWVLVAVTAVTAAVGLVWIRNIQNHQNDAIDTLICSIESKELHPRRPLKQPTLKQRHMIVQFWSEEIRLAHLAPCNLGGNA